MYELLAVMQHDSCLTFQEIAYESAKVINPKAPRNLSSRGQVRIPELLSPFDNLGVQGLDTSLSGSAQSGQTISFCCFRILFSTNFRGTIIYILY